MKNLRKWLVVFGGTGLVLFALANPQAIKGTLSQIDRRRQITERERFGFKNVVYGRVLDDRGNPVGGIRVGAGFRMHQTGMIGEGDAETDGNGRYEIRALGVNDFMVGV